MKLDADHSFEKILSICYAIPMADPIDPACIWGAVPSFQGPPGTGKSSRVKQSGKLLDLPVGIIELGGRQPEDASGAPFLTREDKLIIACLLGAINELNAIGKGVLFLDEINWARPNTQGAFLSMVQDRRVGDTVFSNLIRIVLASNPQASAGGGHPLIPPMANRCLHFEVSEPSEEEENSYLMGQSHRKVNSVENTEMIIKEKWQDVWGKMVGRMIGFKRKFAQYRLAEPRPGDPDHHKAWPSPRSREIALRAITTVAILDKHFDKEGKEVVSPLEDVFIEAACGKKMAVDWALYRDEANIPDPLDMLTNGWKPDSKRLDRTMAAYSGCVAYLLSRQSKDERLNLAPAMWGLFEPLFENGMADIALSPAQSMVKAGLGTKAGGAVEKAAKPILVGFSKKGMDKYITND